MVSSESCIEQSRVEWNTARENREGAEQSGADKVEWARPPTTESETSNVPDEIPADEVQPSGDYAKPRAHSSGRGGINVAHEEWEEEGKLAERAGVQCANAHCMTDLGAKSLARSASPMQLGGGNEGVKIANAIFMTEWEGGGTPHFEPPGEKYPLSNFATFWSFALLRVRPSASSASTRGATLRLFPISSDLWRKNARKIEREKD